MKICVINHIQGRIKKLGRGRGANPVFFIEGRGTKPKLIKKEF